MNTVDFRPALSIISRENTARGSLIPILQKIQSEYGYLPKEVLTLISKRIDLPLARVLGAATFYSQFRFEPKGKNVIKICRGTACHIGGSLKLTESLEERLGIRTGATTSDMLFTLERVACLGCCSLAPVMMINGTTYGSLTQKKIARVIREYGEKG